MSTVQPTATPRPGAWAQFHLTGKLILITISSNGGETALKELDFAIGSQRKLAAYPLKSWLAAFAISPDGQQIVLAYSPPPDGNKPQLGYTDLYMASTQDPTQVKPLIVRKETEESFFFPTWSPDGNWIYYSHFYRSDPKVPTYKYEIERMKPGGKPEVLVKDAMWPRLSPDGNRLAYLNINPISGGNDLMLADPSGKDPVAATQPRAYPAVDAHNFLADGKHILFSAVNLQPAPALSWWERLFGIDNALAHNVPSDWYLLEIATRSARRLTNLNDTGMYAARSPDGKWIAFIASSGMYVMRSDGSDLTQLSSEPMAGTIEWLP